MSRVFFDLKIETAMIGYITPAAEAVRSTKYILCESALENTDDTITYPETNGTIRSHGKLKLSSRTILKYESPIETKNIRDEIERVIILFNLSR